MNLKIETELTMDRERSSKRTRALVLLLLLIIIGLSLTYVWISFGTTREMRVQSALERNRTMAQLSARLLDEQCEDVVMILNELAQSEAIQSARFSQGRSVLRQSVRFDVDLSPELLFLAIYSPEGKLIDQYPQTPTAPPIAVNTERDAHSTLERQPFIWKVMTLPNAQKTEVLVAARPLGDPSRPGGYILAYYRLGFINEWMQHLHITDGTLFLLDITGRVVDTTGNTQIRLTDMAPDLPARLAQEHQRNAQVVDGLDGKRKVIGYAYVTEPRWLVLVIQNEETALGPTDYLFRRLIVLVIVLLALMPAAGWMLVSLFQRREQMARQLAQQNERLREADRAKSDFLANVSHELRTPLANLQISVSGLLDPDVTWEPEQTRECLQLASEELDQLTARIRNLLDMSRIDAHAHQIHKEPNDITDIVGAALERLRPMIGSRHLQADFPAEPLLAECDQAQIETVVVNLVENALKYSPPGTAIRLRGQVEKESVRITVYNEGPGIASEEEARLFEKFYRAASTRAAGGTGLGLAICKAIVEAHGGAIGAMNVPGGTEFWFSLPAASFQEVLS